LNELRAHLPKREDGWALPHQRCRRGPSRESLRPWCAAKQRREGRRVRWSRQGGAYTPCRPNCVVPPRAKRRRRPVACNCRL